MADNMKYRAGWRIDRFKDEDGSIAKRLQAGESLDKILKEQAGSHLGTDRIDGNLALNEGIQHMIDLICGLNGASVLWNEANAHIGVGDSGVDVTADQTGLQAVTNYLYKAMDTGYPSRAGQIAEWRATYGPTEANYTWNEYTVANGSTGTGKNLNRRVENKGTKVLGETWTLALQMLWS